MWTLTFLKTPGQYIHQYPMQSQNTIHWVTSANTGTKDTEPKCTKTGLHVCSDMMLLQMEINMARVLQLHSRRVYGKLKCNHKTPPKKELRMQQTLQITTAATQYPILTEPTVHCNNCSAPRVLSLPEQWVLQYERIIRRRQMTQENHCDCILGQQRSLHFKKWRFPMGGFIVMQQKNHFGSTKKTFGERNHFLLTSTTFKQIQITFFFLLNRLLSN